MGLCRNSENQTILKTGPYHLQLLQMKKLKTEFIALCLGIMYLSCITLFA